MEKLIELLNEWKGKSYIFYMPDGADKVHRKETDAYGDIYVSCIKNCELISKEFDFIEWLLDNDKIDLDKLEEKAERKPQYTFIDDDGRLGFKLFEVYESLLMLLAIQDEPINFLISILK